QGRPHSPSMWSKPCKLCASRPPIKILACSQRVLDAAARHLEPLEHPGLDLFGLLAGAWRREAALKPLNRNRRVPGALAQLIAREATGLAPLAGFFVLRSHGTGSSTRIGRANRDRHRL